MTRRYKEKKKKGGKIAIIFSAIVLPIAFLIFIGMKSKTPKYSATAVL